MAQAQMRQLKKYDKKILQAKPYAVCQYVSVFQKVILPKGTKKTTQEVQMTIHDHRSTPAGTVLPFEYGASSAL